MKYIILIACFVVVLAVSVLALEITCLATPNWGTDLDSNFSTGLNSYCNGTVCQFYTKEQKVGALFATTFFVWLGIIVSFFGCMLIITGCYYWIKEGSLRQKILSIILAIVFGINGLAMLVAMSCFTGGYSGYQFGYSYFLGWTAFALSFFSSLVLLFSNLCWHFYSKKNGL